VLQVNWAFTDKQEFIDIVEVVYRGARKGRGLVVSPKGAASGPSEYALQHQAGVTCMRLSMLPPQTTPQSTGIEAAARWCGGGCPRARPSVRRLLGAAAAGSVDKAAALQRALGQCARHVGVVCA
jgi:hypothetical protein